MAMPGYARSYGLQRHALCTKPVVCTCSAHDILVIQAPFQARGQAEPMKHGLQHHMGLDTRNHHFVASEHQMRRPACASAQSGQRLHYSLSETQSNLGHIIEGLDGGWGGGGGWVWYSLFIKKLAHYSSH